MEPYTVYLQQDAHQFILARRSADRKSLYRFLDGLSIDPFQDGDSFVRDAAQRRMEVKLLGRFEIVFWADHPVKEVKVVRIRVLPKR